MRPPLAFLPLLLVGTAEGQDGLRGHPIQGGTVVRPSEHYEVHLHFDGPDAIRTVDGVVDLAEDAYERTMRALRLPPEMRVDWLLGVHVYPSKQAYAEVEARLTQGHFRDNESFSHWNSRTAHVALAPPLAPDVRLRFGISSQTREVLAHEAAHLAVYSAIPTYRWHPTWFGEGLAMAVELDVLREHGLVVDPAEHPRTSSDQLLARNLLESERLPSVDEILQDELPDLHSAERYAVWREFFGVLASDGPAFRALVDFVRATPGGRGMRPEVAQFVRERYGTERLETELAERIAALDPRWDEVYRSLETRGDDWLQTAFPNHEALAWRRDPTVAPPYRITGRYQAFPADARMQLLLGREPEKPAGEAGWVAVLFEGGEVRLHLRDEEDGWDELAAAELPPASGRALRDGRSFQVDVLPQEVVVTIGEEVVLRGSLEGHELAGPWGIGVAPGAAGLWRGLRLAR